VRDGVQRYAGVPGRADVLRRRVRGHQQQRRQLRRLRYGVLGTEWNRDVRRRDVPGGRVHRALRGLRWDCGERVRGRHARVD
jgi:hypothetical protein